MTYAFTCRRNLFLLLEAGRIAESCRTLQKLAEHSRNWQKLAELGRIWQNLVEFWKNLAEFGRIWQNFLLKTGGGDGEGASNEPFQTSNQPSKA